MIHHQELLDYPALTYNVRELDHLGWNVMGSGGSIDVNVSKIFDSKSSQLSSAPAANSKVN